MKRVVLIAAVVFMNIGLFSCEKESSITETQALYEDLDTSASDDDEIERSSGSGGN